MAQGLTLFKNEAAYQTMVSRGCKYNCSYCCTNALKRIYNNEKNYLRRRNIENVIAELNAVINKFDFITNIWFSDDSFFAADIEEIKGFSQIYKKTIGLPFYCLTNPLDITEEKLSLLLDAGLRRLQMGIETGSEKIQKLYNRSIANKKVREAAHIINKFRSKMDPPTYDMILNNPYEDEEDIFESLSLLVGLPKPNRIQIFSLSFFPETSLTKKAIEDNIIKEDSARNSSIYSSRRSYLGYLFLFYNKIPHWMAKPLLRKSIVRLWNKKYLYNLYNSVYTGLYKMWNFWFKVFSRITTDR